MTEHSPRASDDSLENPLQIGILIFDGVDQIDVTGPFEVLASLPDAVCRLYGTTMQPVRDMNGLLLTPDALLADVGRLDVLHVPGGAGQEQLMDDLPVLEWIRDQADTARYVLSVCTGALLLGAAGLLVGRRATTHWASLELLTGLGAEAVNERVVVDGNYVFSGGVTAGIDAALVLAAMLRGDDAARAVQLRMQYAPDPPFNAGEPDTAPTHIVDEVVLTMSALAASRRASVARAAKRIGIPG